jgi:UPF0716 protein FxsA
MGFRARLLIFGYPLAEILILWGIASLIGWGWALLGLLAGFPIGLALMRNAGSSAVGMTRADPQAAQRLAVTTVGQFFAGVLFFVPGYLTDLCGAALLVPGIRSLVGGRLSRSFAGQSWMGRFPGSGDVIRGTVIVEDIRFDSDGFDSGNDEGPPPALGR